MMRSLRRERFDLILVETNAEALEDRSAFSWLNCRTGESTPVVMLSQSCASSQVAAALEAGADDFIRQSADPAVLVARLNAVLRRSNRTNTRRAIEVHGFSLDREAGVFLDRGIPVELTTREFTMAWLFFSSPGVYLSRDTISVAIWGVDSEITCRTIEQHIYKLRKKLNLCDGRGVRIHTAYTKGYRLELCAEAEHLAPSRDVQVELACA